MVDILGLTELGAEAVAILTSVLLVVLVWQRREKPTARPFLWVALTLCVAAVVHTAHLRFDLVSPVTGPLLVLFGDLVGYDLTVGQDRQLWVALQMVRDGILAGFWFVFVLQYTGRRGRIEQLARRSLAGLVVVSICLWAVFAVWVSPLLLTVSQLAQLVLEATLVAGGVMLLTMSTRHAALPAGQAGLLGGGVIGLVVLQILTTATRVPILVPIAIGGTSVCFIAALARYRVFDTLPVATTVGRNQVVESVGEGIVIVDRQQQLYDCNDSAAAQLGIDQSTSTGESLSALQPAVPEPRRLANVDGTVRVQIPEGPLLTMAASEIENERDQRLGYTIVTRDVTDRYNREQRLSLLNQLLVDIAHDRMETVTREATDIAEGERRQGHPDEVGDWIWDTTTELATLVARTREIEETLASETDQRGTGRTDVSTTVSGVVEEFADAPVDLVTRYPDGQRLTAVDETLVEIATRTLLEDATEQPVGAVAVEVTETDSEAVAVRLDARVPPDSQADPRDVVDELSVQVARLAVNCVGGDVDVQETAHTLKLWIRLPTDRPEQHVVGTPPQSDGVRP